MNIPFVLVRGGKGGVNNSRMALVCVAAHLLILEN